MKADWFSITRATKRSAATLHNARETVNIERDNAAVGWAGPSQAQLVEVARLEAEYQRVTGHAAPRSTFELLNTPLEQVSP
jgi:hypothetical protein